MENQEAWRRLSSPMAQGLLGIDATTLEIRAIEVTDNVTGDAPMLLCLPNQISEDETIASVSGYGAYDTKLCHEAVAQRGTQAIIPIRKNAKPWKEGLTSEGKSA